jgi:adenylate kinase
VVRRPFILLIGPPGSGKSTQAEAVSKSRSIPVLSAEQMINENQELLAANRNTRISGMELRSDPALNRIFGTYLTKGGYQKGLVLDGYPSTKDHCDYLVKLVSDGTIPAPVVLQLDVDDAVVRKRMKSQEGVSLEQRIKDYHREMDMIQLYFPNAEIVKIDASKKTSKVTKEINKVLSARLAEKN